MARKSGDAEHVEVVNETTGEIVEAIDFRNIASMADYVAAIGGQDAVILAHEELGDGFAEVEKDALVSVRCILVDWTFHVSDKFTRNGQPTEWVRVRGIDQNGRKFWFADGGAGVYAQLRKLTDRTGKREALYVHDGLVRSDYTYTDEKGDTSPATTYYISEGAPA
jgi:hypothetical protein